MYITPHMLGYANWYAQKTTREILFFIPFMQVFLIGPVVFIYTRYVLNEEFRFSKKDCWHFAPAILYGIYSIVVFVMDKLILNEFFFYADGRDKDLADWYQFLGLTSMSIYLIMSLKIYFSYRNKIFNELSYAESILLVWVRNFMISFLLLIVLRGLFFIFNPDWGEFGSQFWYYISFSLVFTYVGIAGYSHSIKLEAIRETSVRIQDANQALGVSQSKKVLLDETKAIQEEKQLLSDEEVNLWMAKLQALMKETKLYENPKLSLFDLADQLDTYPKVISTTVNKGFEMNFNDFVNKYRTEAVQEKLKNGEQESKTLLGIAMECGFNSKATFNRAFKKNTSKSPKEYLNSLN